ncbi:MAG TPA: ABC transporter substrate-binding protein [Amycolatopsis sp.]|nr:ABC transporter substrate-binding protein [Amycolatopsis sp.]
MRRTMRFAPRAATVLALTVGLAACGTTASTSNTSVSGSGKIDTSACPPAATQAVTGDTIVLGTSGPLSGTYASVGATTRAIQAYVDVVNSQGGLQTKAGKKKLQLITLDDKYEAGRVQNNVHELVEKDGVTAVVGLVGTANAKAVQPYLNQHCVPELFPLAGSASMLSKSTPFTSMTSTYVDQGVAMGKFIRQHYPNATIGALVQNDDTGNDTMRGIESALQGSGVRVIAKQSYEPTDPDVKAQMTTLVASGADVFVDLALGVKCTQSLSLLKVSPLRPKILTASMCSAGAVAAADAADLTQQMYRTNNTKSSSVAYGNDPDYQLFHQAVEARGVNPGDAELGWLTFQFCMAAIGNAEPLSSVGIAEAAFSLPPDTNIGFLEKGLPLSSELGKATIQGYTLDKWDSAHAQFVPTGEPSFAVS